jgi:exodeoxyribonuclease V beta subunit
VTTPFHPLQPLPRGTTLLEASAGTGKTWSITTLVLRLVAEEGLRMSELLLVTFTEAATEELKDRVRLRLAEAAAALHPEAAAAAEPTLAAWVEGLGEEGRVRAHRALLRAAEEFDQAAISTIHAFCKRTLEELAFEAGAELGLDLAQDLSPYVEEIVDDVLTADLVHLDPQTWRAVALGCGWTREGLGQLARLALQDPRAAVLPAPRGLAALRADWQARRGALADGLRQTWGPALIAEFEAVLKPRLKPRQRTWTLQRLRDDIDAAVHALAASPLPGPAALGPLAEWAEDGAFDAQLVDPDDPPPLRALDPLRPWTAPAALAGPLRADFVQRLRARLTARKAEDGVCGFDDLLLLLRDRLLDPEHGPALAAALAARYRGVFIDEFQDTDAVQWTIFERCFHEAGRGAGGPTHHLFLIGDPKQAIYRFRGADLHVYLRAAAQADLRFTMTRNHRSDAAAVRANNLLLGDDADGIFCQPPITYIEVDTPAREPAQRLRGPDGAPASPLCLRWVDPAAVAQAGGQSDEAVSADALRSALRPQLVDDAVGLLGGGHTLWSQGRWRPLAPGDLAVLTRRNDEATALAAALAAAGVPAVVRSSASVFATPEAETLTAFLQALMDPGREGPARALALCPGWGWTVEGLMQPGAAWELWLARLRRWRRTMEGAGLMVALRAALDDLELIPRLLARPGGARAVTNLQHVAELAHAAERRLRLGLPSLLAWLLRQRAERPEDADAVVLRLETDDEAVSVLTMHRSKGLEYPVVLLPELWMRPGGRPQPYALGRDPDDPDGLRRVLDLRVGDPALAALHAAADHEGLQEDMRLLYVALTRARHQTWLYTGPVTRLERSPLAVLLHAARPGAAPADRAAAAAAVAERAPAALRAELAAWVEALEAQAPGSAALLAAGPLRPRRWSPPPAPAEALGAAAWTRGPFSTRWQRYSYSALTRGQHGGARAAQPAAALDEAPAVDPRRPGFDPDRVREHIVEDDVIEDVSAEVGLPVPLAEAPANAEAGTFLHAVLEHADFTWAEGGPEGAAQLAAVIATQLGHHGFSAADWGPQLGPGLTAALRTPLGGPLGGRALSSIPRGDRLDELRFDLPISGGDRWRREGRPLRPVTTRGFAAAFAQRPPDAAMGAAYIRGLQQLELGELVGFLTGSIDLVLRAEVDGRPQWFVVDYKSNRLALPGQLPTTGAYTLPRLRAAMEEHHYFVQYHLYTLALHRYLRSRLGAGFDYDRDFGGVYYLFLRGMIGPDTPTVEGQRAGVFFDKPPVALVTALDQLFGAEEA